MRWALVILVVLGTLAGAARGAAGIDVRMGFEDGGRGGEAGWETLRVSVRENAGAVGVNTMLWLQDARGGPMVGRSVTGTEDRAVLAALPLAGATDLPAGVWPVRVTLKAGDAVLASAEVNVRRGVGTGNRRPWRVAVVRRETGGNETAALAALGGDGGVSVMYVTPDEVLNDPPVVFGGCDAVVVDGGTLALLPTERAAALMACGVRVVTLGPEKSATLRVFWPERAIPTSTAPATAGARAGEDVWVAPREAAVLGSPAVVAPYVVNVPVPAVSAGTRLRWLGMLITPVAMAVVVAACVLVRRRALVAVAAGGGVAAVTAAGIWALSGALTPTTADVVCVTRHAPGAVVVTDTFVARGRLFAGTVEVVSPDGPPPTPVAATPDAWLSYGQIEIELAASGAGGGKLTARLPGRVMQLFAMRSVHAAPELSAGPPEPAPTEGYWIQNGHVRAAGGENAEDQAFERWLATQPADGRLGLRTWYNTVCQIPHRYYLRTVQTGGVSVVDYGP